MGHDGFGRPRIGETDEERDRHAELALLFRAGRNAPDRDATRRRFQETLIGAPDAINGHERNPGDRAVDVQEMV